MSVNVQINVTESVSPKNGATIDRPDLNLIGNVYSKAQVEDKLTSVAGTSYLGELPKTYNFPTTGSYTFNPIETGIYTINGHALPAITQQDFDDYLEIIIRVTNGVPSLTKKQLPMSVAPSFDPTDSTKAQGAKQINSWLVNDVEGGESDDISQTEEQIGNFYKNIGISLVGPNGSSIQAGAFNVVTNSTAVADADKFLTKGFINLNIAGNFKFCIGTWDATNNKFVIRWLSDEKIGVVGWNEFSFQEKIKAGEIAAVFCLSSSTASMRWGDPGASGNRFQQFSTVSGMAQANLGSYFSIYFELKDIDIITLPSEAKFNLSKSVAKIVEGFSNNGYTGAGSEKGEAIVSADSDAVEGYAINKVNLETSYKLEQLQITTVTAGVYNIVTGFIEQAGKFIEKNVITKTLTTGLNTISIDPIILEVGDYVGFKFPGKYPVNNAPSVANLWASNSYIGALTQVAGKSLPIKLFLKEYIDTPIATKSDLQPINSSIVGLQQNFIFNGKKVKLTFNADGSVLWEYTEGFSNILHLGNSFAKHAVTSLWWGTWGMAASEMSKDYVHRFLAKMKELKPLATTDVLNIAGWEASPSTWNKSQLDPYLTGKDLICIRLSENVPSNVPFQSEFASLISYIKGKNSSAKLLIGGAFWVDEAKDNAMKNVAQINNITFVPLSHLDIPANKSYVGAQVKGDDGQWHTVNDSGVARHAGDVGMEAIATEMFNALGL